jgi:hypothetical protein
MTDAKNGHHGHHGHHTGLHNPYLVGRKLK